MKKYLLILSGIAMAMTSIAQPRTFFSGNISNTKSEKVVLVIHYKTEFALYDSVKTLTSPILNGNFSFRIGYSLPKPTFCMLNIDNDSIQLMQLPLSEGDSIYITSDARHLDSTLVFSGKGAGKNIFFQRYNLEQCCDCLYDRNLSLNDLYNQENQNYQKQAILLDRITLHKGMEPESYTYFQNFLSYYHKVHLLKYFTKKLYTDSISIGILKEIDNMKPNNDRDVRYEYYHDFIDQYILWKMQFEHISKGVAINKYLTGKTKMYYLASTLKNNSFQLEPSELKQMVTQLTTMTQDKDLIAKAEESVKHVEELNRRYPAKESKIVSFSEPRLVVIEGYVHGFMPGETYDNLVMVKGENVLFLNSQDSKAYSTVIKDNGTFRLEFPAFYSTDIEIRISYSSEKIYVSPGDHIYIETDNTNDERAARYFGDNAETNYLIDNFLKHWKANFENSYPYSQYAKDNGASAFKKYRTTWYEKEKAFVKKFIDMNNPNPIFEKWANYYVDYIYAENLVTLLWEENDRKDILADKKIAGSYFDFMKQIPVESTMGLMCSSFISYEHEFRTFMNIIPNYGISNEYKRREGSDEFDILSKKYKGTFLDIMLSQSMVSIIQMKKRADDYIKESMDKFNRLVSNNAIKAFINHEYHYRDSLCKAPLKESITLHYKNTDENILDEIKAKYKGKVVCMLSELFVGVERMFTPCFKKITEKFGADHIAFVFVYQSMDSLNSSNEIKEAGIPGDYYLLSRAQFNSFGNYHFKPVLLSKKGELITGKAESLADERLISYIGKLLNM